MAEYTFDKIEYSGNVYKIQDTTTPTMDMIAGTNVTIAPSGSAIQISSTDEKLTVNELSTGYTGCPIMNPFNNGSGSTTPSTKYVDTNGFKYTPTYSSNVGTAEITLGNSIAAGTTNNKRGVLTLYGKQSYWAAIKPAETMTTNVGLSLPAKEGTFALLSDINAKDIINSLSTGTSNATRNDYIIAQASGGNSASPVDNNYYRRPLSKVFAALNSSDVTTALGYTPARLGSTNANNGDMILSTGYDYYIQDAYGSTRSVVEIYGDNYLYGYGNYQAEIADSRTTLYGNTIRLDSKNDINIIAKGRISTSGAKNLIIDANSLRFRSYASGYTSGLLSVAYGSYDSSWNWTGTSGVGLYARNDGASGVRESIQDKWLIMNDSSGIVRTSMRYTSARTASSSEVKNYIVSANYSEAPSSNKSLLAPEVSSTAALGVVLGTTSQEGITRLYLGNSTASGSEDNSSGRIWIYSSGSNYGALTQASGSGNYVHTLPAATGTVLNTGTTSFTRTHTNGTKIGSIKINNTSTDIFSNPVTTAYATVSASAADTWTNISSSFATFTVPAGKLRLVSLNFTSWDSTCTGLGFHTESSLGTSSTKSYWQTPTYSTLTVAVGSAAQHMSGTMFMLPGFKGTSAQDVTYYLFMRCKGTNSNVLYMRYIDFTM